MKHCRELFDIRAKGSRGQPKGSRGCPRARGRTKGQGLKRLAQRARLQKVPDSCYMSKAGADTIVTSMLAFLRKPHIVVTFDLNSLVFIAYPCGVSQYMTLGP